MRQILLTAVVTVITFFSSYAQAGTLRVHFVDVGYGNAVLVEFPEGGTMLIDAGNKGTYPRLKSYLTAQHIQTIDSLVLTSNVRERQASIPFLLEDFSPAIFYTNDDLERAEPGYQDIIEILIGKHIPISNLARGIVIRPSKEINIYVLNPDDFGSAASHNAAVLFIQHKAVTILLTSDVSLPVQREIAKEFPEILSANLVEIPSHGGVVASEWLKGMSPDAYVVSVGPNTFGRPSQATLSRIKGRVFRTDRDGSLVFESDGKVIQPILPEQKLRDRRRR